MPESSLIARTWRRGSKAYLLVVNTSEEKASARIGFGERFSGVVRRAGNGVASQDGQTISVSLPKIGFAVLEIGM